RQALGRRAPRAPRPPSRDARSAEGEHARRMAARAARARLHLRPRLLPPRPHDPAEAHRGRDALEERRGDRLLRRLLDRGAHAPLADARRARRPRGLPRHPGARRMEPPQGRARARRRSARRARALPPLALDLLSGAAAAHALPHHAPLRASPELPRALVCPPGLPPRAVRPRPRGAARARVEPRAALPAQRGAVGARPPARLLTSRPVVRLVLTLALLVTLALSIAVGAGDLGAEALRETYLTLRTGRTLAAFIAGASLSVA